MRVVRLALMTVAAGLLMAPGLGSTSVGDSSATLPIGDVPVGVRGAGCPDFAATPDVHVAARFESYANNDPVTALTDQGSLGVDFTQGTGSKQPTARVPCETGKLGGQPCASGDGGDIIQSATHSSRSVPDLTCALLSVQTPDIGPGNKSHVSAATAGNERDIWNNSTTLTLRGGAQAIVAGAIIEDNYQVICVHWNGVSSEAWIDGVSTGTINLGSDTTEGVTLFARSNDTQNSSSRIAELIYYDTVTTAQTMVADVMSVLECQYGGASFPQALSVTTTDVNIPKAVKRYARRLAQRGATPLQIGIRVRDGLLRRGYSAEDAETLGRAMAKAARGRKGRDVDTLHTVRVGLATRPATAAAHGALIADALCRPLIDEDGAQDPAAAACLAAESQYMGERWCVAGTQTVALRGARAWLTADDYAAVSDVVRDTTGLRGVRDADDATYAAFMQDAADRLPGSPTVERCVGAP